MRTFVGWKLAKNGASAAPRATVTCTYCVAPAPWTQDAAVQKVFPVVASVVHGAGTAQLQEQFTLTAKGWLAVDLQGS